VANAHFVRFVHKDIPGFSVAMGDFTTVQTSKVGKQRQAIQPVGTQSGDYVHPISVRIIYSRFGCDSTEAELGDGRKGWLQAV
jgi:hypothetical protein